MNSAGLSPSKPTIAYFGFINPNKGVETLIKASAGIDAQILVLAALDVNNPYHEEISELIENAKNQGAKLYVAGFLENEQLSQILQECLFFVLPQPLPLTAKSGTAIAASGHKLPVISKGSENPEYNAPYIHNKNAILLQNMNAETLATACNDLLSSQEKLNH
jgi:glycosyltransferase involved in cell wall biosynthesis